METLDEVNVGIELLEGDLHTLFKLIVTHRRPVTESDIRAASGILRRWLLEGTIGKLANKLDVRATFPLNDNSAVFEAIPHAADIRYYLTAGVSLNGHPYMHVYDSKLPADAPRSLPIGNMPIKMVSVSKLLTQPRLFFADDSFTCEEIIRFTANRLGGVHLDFRRKDRETMLETAGQYMTFGGPLNRVEIGTPGKLHLDVEPQSREALSALHLVVVSAASSLLQVHFDGQPLLKFERKRSIASRVWHAIGLKRKPTTKLYELGDDIDDRRS